MYATKDLSDAIDVTRAFLAGASFWTWIKLAVIVFFVGGVMSGTPPTPGGGGGEFGGEPTPGTGTDPGAAVGFGEMLPVLIGIAAIGLAIYLVFAFIGSLLEFALLESLRSGEVHVRRYTKRNLELGVRLFGFRLALILIALVVFGVPAYALYTTMEPNSAAFLGAIALLAIPVFLVYAVVNRFTTVFVAPTMLQEDLGVVAAWKRFRRTLAANWKEYLVYLLLVWIVQLGLAFALGIVFFIGFIILAIPLILIAFIPIIGILIVFLAIPFLLLLSSLVQVPVVVYLRYYALLVLGDTDAELDLVPDQRARVRGDVTTESGESDGWDSNGDHPDDGWDSDDDRPDDRPADEDGDDGTDSWSGPDHWDSSDEGDSGKDTDSPDSTDRWDDSDTDRDDDRSGW
ncbi:DUF7544 domain-containing protein [Natrinema salsiterrestre]|uniref:Uncharacterized protein n=1 Tax=Natrinema salsiterrestre TaxID=2950540 RepID=A0A9Q4Q2F3_9EURY|nr:hypothetical protein [Natrinema salsiterrestre]MDF9745203.1 hypothetical protein [Natrinema salsiterrestre]